jgi:hypothetical protein
MPRNLKRYNGRGDLNFVTFSCYRRLPLLRTIRARNLFVRALGAVHERYNSCWWVMWSCLIMCIC